MIGSLYLFISAELQSQLLSSYINITVILLLALAIACLNRYNWR